MRKFTIKHRQKRKYIRKSNLQSSYLFTRTIAGSLPIISLCVAFFVMVVMDLNVRDHVVLTIEYISKSSFFWDGITQSLQSLLTAFAQLITGLLIIRDIVFSVILVTTQFLTAIFMVVWNFVIAILTAIDAMITAAFSTVYSVIRIPFDAAAALWEQVRPYAVMLGYNMQLALEDMKMGFVTLGRIGTVLQSGL